MTQQPLFPDDRPRANPLPFGGKTYDAKRDGNRLASALGRVYQVMSDGRWRSLAEIAQQAKTSEAGASARLRDLRKASFRETYPTKAVESKRVDGGLWMYRVVV